VDLSPAHPVACHFPVTDEERISGNAARAAAKVPIQV
jgi:hypothetical protein